MISNSTTLNNTVNVVMSSLKMDGMSDEEAWGVIVDKYEEAISLKEQMIEYGYSESESYYVASQKLANSIKNQGIEDIKYGKIIPLRVVVGLLGGSDWHSMNDYKRATSLWDLGFDTKKFGWFTNAGCFNYEDRRECAVFIQGSERLDNEWLTKKVGGVSVASMEAKYHKDPEQLAVLRGQRRD